MSVYTSLQVPCQPLNEARVDSKPGPHDEQLFFSKVDFFGFGTVIRILLLYIICLIYVFWNVLELQLSRHPECVFSSFAVYIYNIVFAMCGICKKNEKHHYSKQS